MKTHRAEVLRLKMYKTGINDIALRELAAFFAASPNGPPRPDELHFSDCPAVTEIGLRAVASLADDGQPERGTLRVFSTLKPLSITLHFSMGSKSKNAM